MTMSVFVSHVYEDRYWIAQLRDWQSRSELGPGLTFTTETDDVRRDGESAIKSHIRPYIEGAGVVLVLVGEDSHNRPWVDYEVAVAQALHKKVVLARIPNTRGAAPPEVASKPIVAWEPRALREALTR